MHFAGLDAARIAIAFVALGGLLLVLYALRPPRRTQLVASLEIWRTLGVLEGAAARFPRLARLRAPLPALAIVLAVLLALGDPQCDGQAGEHVVLLIDRSASMAATDVAPTRLAQAKQQAGALIAHLDARDRALIVALDAQAIPLTPFTDDARTLRTAIDGLAPRDTAGDLARGIAVARSLLEGRPRTRVVLFSDGNLAGRAEAERLVRSAPPLAFAHAAVGSPARNVAISTFAVRSYPRDARHHACLVTLTNFGAQPEALVLRIRAAGRLLHEASATLAPFAEATLTIDDLPGVAVFDAEITLARGPDALARDDRAQAVGPARARVRALVVSRGNRYLEAALLLDERLDVIERRPEDDLRGVAADIAIFDAVVPATPPDLPTLFLGQPAEAGDVPRAKQGSLRRPFFDRVVDDHPLVDGLALRDVNIAQATRIALEAGDVNVGATADRQPLLFEGRQGGAPFIALTFDLRDSDLPLRPAFPLLMLRAIDRLTLADDALAPHRVAGEPFVYALPHGAPTATLVAPDGSRRSLVAHAGSVRIESAQAGVHLLEAGGARAALVVSLPAGREGALAPVRIAAEPARTATADSWSAMPAWRWLAAAALAVLALEWLGHQRRWIA